MVLDVSGEYTHEWAFWYYIFICLFIIIFGSTQIRLDWEIVEYLFGFCFVLKYYSFHFSSHNYNEKKKVNYKSKNQ